MVFRAIQPHVGRDVAVKVFHEQVASDPAFVLRFEPEAQAAAALEHPHIVPMYDYWREPGRAYVVSRYMRGGSLRRSMSAARQLDRDRALRIVEQVASALAFAHRQGVAHGDVVAVERPVRRRRATPTWGTSGSATGRAPDAEDDRPRPRGARARPARGTTCRRSLAEILDTAVGATDGPGADAIADAARARPRTSNGGHRAERRTSATRTRDFGRSPRRTRRTSSGERSSIQRLLERLNDRFRGARFLAVVGPSGCGKSSLVRAGLVPALREAALADSSRCSSRSCSPGAHPLDELESALVRVATRPPTRLGDLLRRVPRTPRGRGPASRRRMRELRPGGGPVRGAVHADDRRAGARAASWKRSASRRSIPTAGSG